MRAKMMATMEPKNALTPALTAVTTSPEVGSTFFETTSFIVASEKLS